MKLTMTSWDLYLLEVQAEDNCTQSDEGKDLQVLNRLDADV